MVEVGDGVVQLDLEVGHRRGEVLNLLLLDQPDAGLGEGKRQPLPVVVDLAADGGDGAEGGMADIQQFLAGAQTLALGVERLGGLRPLLGREGLLGAHPAKGDPDGGHGRAKPLGGRGRG